MELRPVGVPPEKPEYHPAFERWWKHMSQYPPKHPRMQDKAGCHEKFMRMRLYRAAIFEWLMDWTERMKRTRRWRADSGEYQPMPATILNNQRWNDPVPEEWDGLDPAERAVVLENRGMRNDDNDYSLESNQRRQRDEAEQD